MQSFAQFVGNLCAVCVISFMLVYVMINAVTGCGQISYFPDRTWQTGDCVGAPWVVTKKGTW
jgi:hypothetical protein